MKHENVRGATFERVYDQPLPHFIRYQATNALLIALWGCVVSLRTPVSSIDATRGLDRKEDETGPLWYERGQGHGKTWHEECQLLRRNSIARGFHGNVAAPRMQILLLSWHEGTVVAV